jgi:hypothetical protein
MCEEPKIIHEALGNTQAAEWDNFKSQLISFLKNDSPACGEPPFCETVRDFNITLQPEVSLRIPAGTRDGTPLEPEILYSGGANALLRRHPCQFLWLHADNKEVLKDLSLSDKVIVKEPTGNEGTANEYAVKVRIVLEPPDDLKIAIEDGYPFLTSLRALVYAHKDKPIKEIIPKEDLSILACILVREEDYEQLERYADEGLPLNENAPAYFRPFKPTPLYYATMRQIWNAMKDPVKMLHWLIAHGADINKTNGEKCTPLWMHCFLDGDIKIMKALLEAGADPNIETIIEDTPYLPLEITANVADGEEEAVKMGYTIEQVENMRQKARLSKPCCYLGEFEIETPEPDTDGQYEGWD